MTSYNEYPWPYYIDLQARSRKLSQMNDYAWGIDRAAQFLLDAIFADTVPANPDELVAQLNRVIASETRLCRSRAAALKDPALEPQRVLAGDPAAEARIDLTNILRLISPSDRDILVDIGVGYSDREIAERCHLTAGTVRTRLSRLRLKIAA